MTENKQKSDAPVKLPPPSAGYMPAETDTVVIVTFYGNTPQIKDIRFVAACAEHAMMASERLKIAYHTMHAVAEQKAREDGILTTSKLPNSELAKG